MRRNRISPLAILLLAACARTSEESAAGYDVSGTVIEEVPALVREALENADAVELLSLFPYPRGVDEELWTERGYSDGELIDDYAVIGKTTLSPNDRRRIVQALYDGIDDSDGMVAACFNPRHGLTMTHQGKRVDVVICYQCLSMQMHLDGEHAANVLTTEAPKRVFNAVLRAAKVPLPDQ